MEKFDLDYKPWGGLAGVYNSQQNTMADNMNREALTRSSLENVVKSRDAAFAQDETNSQALRDSRLAGMIGENQSKEAKGFVDYNSMDASLKAKLAEARKSATADGIAAERLAIDKFLAAGEASGFNPVMMLSTIEDPQMKQQVAQIVQQQGPQAAYQLAKQMREMYVQLDADTGKHRNEMEKQKSVNDTSVKTTGMNNATNIKLEQMRIDAGKYKKGNSLTIIDQLLKNGNYSRAAMHFDFLAMNEEDPEQRQKYLQEAAKYEQMAKELAAASAAKPGGIDIPATAGLPRQPISAPRLGAGQQPTNLPDPLGIRK